MILGMGLEVARQVVDPLAQKGNLHFRGARILRVSPELLDYTNFGFDQLFTSG